MAVTVNIPLITNIEIDHTYPNNGIPPKPNFDSFMTNVLVDVRNGTYNIRKRWGLKYMQNESSYTTFLGHKYDDAVLHGIKDYKWQVDYVDKLTLNTPITYGVGYFVKTKETNGDMLLNLPITGTSGHTGIYAGDVTGATYVELVNATHGITEGTRYAEGIAYLDNYAFICDIEGKLYNSNLSDIYTWTSTDFLTVGRVSDEKTFICQHKNNICVIGENSIEFFYNAGNPGGSPLAPREDVYYTNVGKTLYDKAYSDNEYVAFAATRTNNRQNGVYLIDNFALKKISTPDIDKFLTNVSESWSHIVHYQGRTLVIVQCKVYGVAQVPPYRTLVYDLTTKLWTMWDHDGQGYMRILSVDNIYLVIEDVNSGYLVYVHLEPDLTTDEVPTSTSDDVIRSTIITAAWDGGIHENKICRKVSLEGFRSNYDTNYDDIMQVSWKDDDYIDSDAREIDLRTYPALYRCGSFRKRKFKLYHDDVTSFDITALNIDIDSTPVIKGD
jgi:hypothetical protein